MLTPNLRGLPGRQRGCRRWDRRHLGEISWRGREVFIFKLLGSKKSRVSESSPHLREWIAAILDVWSLNCSKEKFDVKVGHDYAEERSIVMYRKKGHYFTNAIKDKTGIDNYERIEIIRSEVSFGGSKSFECDGKFYYVDEKYIMSEDAETAEPVFFCRTINR